MQHFDGVAALEFSPSTRLMPPAYDSDDLDVAAPPDITPPARGNPLIRILPIVTALATVAAMATMVHTRTGGIRNPVFLLLPVAMLISTIATAVAGSDRRGGDVDRTRAEYLGLLSGLRSTAVSNAAAQRHWLSWHYPEPDSLWTLIGGCRMWERRASADDFCHVRIGCGPRELARRVIAPTIESARQSDPVTVGAMRRFVDTYATVADLPVVIALSGSVRVDGETAAVHALLRSLICQLAVLHSPDVVAIAAVVSDHRRPDWDWLKWLPHNRHPNAVDDAGPVRMVYSSTAAAERSGLPAGRRLITIVDDGGPGVTLSTDSDDPQTMRLRIRDGDVVVESPGGEGVSAVPDQMSSASALACAQRLAGYRPGAVEATTGKPSWTDLAGIVDVDSYSPADHWSSRRDCNRLRVPVGTSAEGVPVELDIKEAAEGGMGPHGLCVGATGSGKSEFLRTVVLGMITQHCPDVLNLVLIDFKGGATFAGLESTRHVAALITNLSDKAALVTRMRDALLGEVNRRQETLRAAGDLDGIAAYRRARRARPDLPALPALFIVVDEFSELLSQQPDFADVFAAIGRLGRSLGMHLLLASQRLDEGRLRGLESHLSYRVCLKTLSAGESRIVLGTSDAHQLPGTPGAAYLRVGTGPITRFDTACVSGPRRAAPARQHASPLSDQRVAMFTSEPVGSVRPLDDAGDQPSILQTIVDRLAGNGPRAHEVWLPPLDAAPPLDAVLAQFGPADPLVVPIGLVDRPFDQRRDPLTIDLSCAAGHVAVVGGPQSGKSTTLRTLITALAVTHDPGLAQFYCLDFGGGMLSALRGWPHVGSVAGRTDTELTRRTVAQIHTLIRTREALFRDRGIDSMAHGRHLESDHVGDVFLIIDGWAGFRRDFEALESTVTTIAAEGLSVGVHLLLAASRWADLRPALRDQIGTRIELRLGDATDSEIDRRRAQQVPAGTPGRGLSPDGLHMVVALPRLDDSASPEGLLEASRALGETLRRRHGTASAPPIAVLPARIDHADISRDGDDSVVLGVEETELATVTIDFTQHRHLLVVGDTECGKTATLRTVCRELLRTTNPEQSQLLIADARRSLLDVVEHETGRIGGYLTSVGAVDEATRRLITELRRRTAPPDATPTQLRRRSWWSGPEIYVIADDYELLGTALDPLADMLPHARDVGLHLVIARRSGGAARAMFEPLLAGLRDAGALTMLMSADPDEGLTVGSVRPSPLPPGRATLIARRSAPRLVQIGWSPPA